MGALGEADRVVVMTTPQSVTATSVLGALCHLELDKATSRSTRPGARDDRGNREVIEANFRRQAISTGVTIPSERLRTVLAPAAWSGAG